LSIKNPTEWHWYFEGGTPETATEQNPAVLYETPGQYSVKLVVTNELGIDSLLRKNYIMVPTLPKADFIADVTEIEEGESVSFTNLSENYPESYKWFFQGGTPQQSSKENPVVRYNKAGIYPVQLKVTNQEGSHTELKYDYITVTPKTAITEQNVLSGIVIYPNPTGGQLNLPNPSKGGAYKAIEIFDMMGRTPLSPLKGGISSLSFGEGSGVRLDISHLPAGIYFIRIQTDNEVVTKKIVKYE
jgi:PKD repeat protein